MVLHYADLAQRAGASTLVIGTEMATLSSDDARWRPLIAEVRSHFKGALTYAANYDEFQRVPFWDALDYVGIDAYFPLAGSADPAPSAADLAAAWASRGYLSAIASTSRRTGKKVLFTELGYRAVHTAAVEPNAWGVPGVADVEAQANAYRAFYDAVARQPWMAGVYWWNVDPGAWWVQDYSPIGKPAETVLAMANLRSMLLRTMPFLEL
jgi:phosphoglycolate phosphatase-like HAD superfamily hydrolase